MRARFGIRPNELPPVLLLFAWCFSVVGAIWLSVVEGEPGDALFFVVSGQVSVEKGGRAVAALGAREDFDDIMRDRPRCPSG